MPLIFEGKAMKDKWSYTLLMLFSAFNVWLLQISSFSSLEKRQQRYEMTVAWNNYEQLNESQPDKSISLRYGMWKLSHIPALHTLLFMRYTVLRINPRTEKVSLSLFLQCYLYFIFTPRLNRWMWIQSFLIFSTSYGGLSLMVYLSSGSRSLGDEGLTTTAVPSQNDAVHFGSTRQHHLILMSTLPVQPRRTKPINIRCHQDGPTPWLWSLSTSHVY